MVFLVCGNAEQVYGSFGKGEFVNYVESDDQPQITIDIPRSRFLGSRTELKHHIEIWTNPDKTPNGYFTQGNMDARNLALPLFGNFPFKKADEKEADCLAQLKKYEYAYVDNQNILCGLSLQFRADTPDKWVFALIKNTNLPPKERAIYIVSSEKPGNFTDKDHPNCVIYDGSDALQHFRSNLGLLLVKSFFDTALPPGTLSIDPRCSVFDQIAQQASVDDFKENTGLLEFVRSTGNASSSSSNPVNGVERLLSQAKCLTMLGQARAVPQQIEMVLRQQGELYEWLAKNPDCDQASVTCAVQLDLWKSNDKRDDLLAKPDFAPAFTKLFSSLEYRRLLEEGLSSKWHTLDDLAALIVVMANNKDLGRCLNYLRTSGMSFNDLFIIAATATLHAPVQFLARYKINEFTANQLTVDCIDALADIERIPALSSAGTAAEPYIKTALLNIIGRFNDTITTMDCINGLLSGHDGDEISEAVSRLMIPFSTGIYRVLSRFDIADQIGERSSAAFSQNKLWLNAAIHLLQSQRDLADVNTSMYQEVFHYANRATLNQSFDQEELANALAALVVCRKAQFGPDRISLDTLLGNPLLARRVIAFTGTLLLEPLICLPHVVQQDVLASLEHLDTIGGITKGRYSDYRARIMEDTPRSHDFRCLLASVNWPETAALLYEAMGEQNMFRDQIRMVWGYHRNAESYLPRQQIIVNSEMTRRLRELNLDDADAVIRLLASQTPNGARFRNAVNEVETRCHRISRHLEGVAPTSQKYTGFQQAVVDYRKNLYQSIYMELTNPSADDSFVNHINAAEAPLKNILNTDRNRFLRHCLKGIANTLLLIITLPTGFYFNRKHKEKTGDFLFFSRPKSSEALIALDRDLPSIVNSPAA